MNLIELRTKRGQLVTEANAINDDAKGREWTSEETQKFDRLMNEATALRSQIDRLERLATESDYDNASRGRLIRDEVRSGDHAEFYDALRSLAVGDLASVRFRLAGQPLQNGETRSAWESRAQSVGTPSAGGYLAAPAFSFELERAMKAFSGIRNIARIKRTDTGVDLPFPMLDTTSRTGTAIAENAENTGSSDLVFTNGVLKAYTYASDIVRVSRQLVRDSAFDIAEEVGAALGEGLARKTSSLFVTGTGTNQPQGVVTGATLGVTGATPTGISYDEIVDLQHSVDPAYRSESSWAFSDSVLKSLKKLRDPDSGLLWQAGLQAGAPDTILGQPYQVIQEMDTFGASKKAVLYGAFKKFVIREVGDVEIIRANERYMEFNQIGLVAYVAVDSRLLDAGTHPIKYFQNSAS